MGAGTRAAREETRRMEGEGDVRSSMGICEVLSVYPRRKQRRRKESEFGGFCSCVFLGAYIEENICSPPHIDTHKCESRNKWTCKVALHRPPSNINSRLDPFTTRIPIPLPSARERQQRLQRRNTSHNMNRVQPAPRLFNRIAHAHKVLDDGNVSDLPETFSLALTKNGAFRGEGLDLVCAAADNAHAGTTLGVPRGNGTPDAAGCAEDENALGCGGQELAAAAGGADAVEFGEEVEDCWEGEGGCCGAQQVGGCG